MLEKEELEIYSSVDFLVFYLNQFSYGRNRPFLFLLCFCPFIR